MRQYGGFGSALRKIEAITDKRNLELVQLAVSLTQRHQVGEQLAWMEQVGKPIDYGHRRLARQLDAGRVGEGSNHNKVDPAREVARNILHRFPFAAAYVLAIHVNHVHAAL